MRFHRDRSRGRERRTDEALGDRPKKLALQKLESLAQETRKVLTSLSSKDKDMRYLLQSFANGYEKDLEGVITSFVDNAYTQW